MTTHSVAGIVLAAGTSSRMGTNKMLLPFGGESVLRGAARRALDGGLSPVLVVLGADADRAAAELDGLPCQTVRNLSYESGVTSSLHAGLATLPETTDAAMILLADMPLVTASMIGDMIRRYQHTHAPLVISDYEGVNAPPMLYDRRLFAELRATPGERCGRLVVQRHRDEAEVLEWPAAALADLDVPEDYARLSLAIAMPPSQVRLIHEPLPRSELADMAAQGFGDMVKAVVDVRRAIMALGAELHSDEEAALLDDGSQQSDLWGINLYPAEQTDDWIEFDSMINVRPAQGNRSRSVNDAGLRSEIARIVHSLIIA